MNPYCLRLRSQGERSYTHGYFYNEDYEKDSQRILALSHPETPGAWCDCSGRAIPISIHRVQHAQGARYHLARFPHTGRWHDPACPLFGEDRPEIQVKAESTEIRLTIPLSYRDGQTAPRGGNPPSLSEGPRVRYPLVTLLAFAKHLFRQARLHQCWEPKMVRYYPASLRLNEAAVSLCCQGRTAAELLFIPRGYDRHEMLETGTLNDQSLARLAQGWRERRDLGLVLGEIRAEQIFPEKALVRINLKALHTDLWMKLDDYQRLMRGAGSWPAAGFLDARRIGRWLIASLRLHDSFQIQTARLLHTTTGYVPVDNPHQAQEAHDLLLKQAVAFERRNDSEITPLSAFRVLGPFVPSK